MSNSILTPEQEQASQEMADEYDKGVAFKKELQGLLNKYSRENPSNTPDFILADYLFDCLESYDFAVAQRQKYSKLYNAPTNNPNL